MNTNTHKILTRRDFLSRTARGTAALTLGLPAIVGGAGDGTEKGARVVLVRDKNAVMENGTYDMEIVTKMLDDAVVALMRAERADDAWTDLLAPEDILGIKTNFWPSLRTPVELTTAIHERAQAIGVPAKKISVDDHGVSKNSVFAEATALINVRPLRIHHWSGIGGCIKNYIMFSPEPWTWHDDSCADLGGLWKLPICAGKTRLNILLVLTPQFHGVGPHHFDAQYTWPYGGLLVSNDPVALDALGVKLLAEKRKAFFERPPKGGTSTKHVELAETRHGIGVADLEKIELVKIGWMEDALI